jgi:large subunit ribosomal protein L24
MKIKKGDTIEVMRGKDAGKRAEVLDVIKDESYKNAVKYKVLVKGVNIVKRARKANPQLGIAGGISEFEKPIDMSNVMFIDKKTDKPTRVGFKIDEKTGKKTRISKDSGEII